MLDKKTKKQIKIKTKYIYENSHIETIQQRNQILNRLFNDELSSIEKKRLRHLNKMMPIKRNYFSIKYKNLDVETYYTFIDDSRNYKTQKDFVINRLKEKIKESRVKNKTMKKENKSFNNINYTTIGGVFVSNNTIKDLKYRNIDWFDSLIPHDNQNYIGLEIECFSNNCTVGHLTKNIVQSGLAQYIRLAQDSSITPDNDVFCSNCDETVEYGNSCSCGEITNDSSLCIELRLLIPENKVNDIVYKTCQLLDELEFSVNDSCGLHVHLDMRHRNDSLCYSRLLEYQSLLYRLVASHRRSNGYCIPVNVESLDDEDLDHYHGISGKFALDKYNTIEVRIHEGTLNNKKITNWVSLLTTIIDRKEFSNEINKYYDLNIPYQLSMNVS